MFSVLKPITQTEFTTHPILKYNSRWIFHDRMMSIAFKLYIQTSIILKDFIIHEAKIIFKFYMFNNEGGIFFFKITS